VEHHRDGPRRDPVEDAVELSHEVAANKARRVGGDDRRCSRQSVTTGLVFRPDAGVQPGEVIGVADIERVWVDTDARRDRRQPGWDRDRAAGRHRNLHR
jgi:hypothetical protein